LGAGGFSFAPAAAGAAPWQAAGHWVEIRQNGRSVGGLGVLARKELEAIVPEGGHVVWLAIDFDELEGAVHPEVHYEAAPIYPGSWQDFSLLWNAAQGFAALEEHISGFVHPLVARREFLYAYKGKGLPPRPGELFLPLLDRRRRPHAQQRRDRRLPPGVPGISEDRGDCFALKAESGFIPLSARSSSLTTDH